MTNVVDVRLLQIQKLREDAFTVTRRIRLGCAAQMIAAARELIAGEPFYMERARELEELQHELEDDSL